jgi:hypothetical protein
MKVSLNYTLPILVSTAHTKSFNSSSGHTALPLELQNSSEFHLLLTPPAYDCPQKTFVVPCKPSAQTYRKYIVIVKHFTGVMSLHMCGSVFTEPLPISGLQNPVVPLLLVGLCVCCVVVDVHVAVCFSGVSAMYLTRKNFFEPYAAIIDYILFMCDRSFCKIYLVLIYIEKCVVQSNRMKLQSIFSSEHD